MSRLLNSPSDTEIIQKIKSKENFHVSGRSQGDNVKQVEDLIEKQGHTVRVKTKGREATLLVPVLGLWNLGAQIAHTLTTYDPDWVIYKAAFGSKIEVKYFGGEA